MNAAPSRTSRRFLETIPVLVPIVACAVIRETFTAAGIALAATVIIAGLFFHRFEISKTRERILTLLALGAGIVVAPIDPSSAAMGRFSEFTLRIALACMLASAVRLAFANGEGQYRPTFVFATIALVACGTTPRSTPYLVAVILFVPTVALALGREHTGARLSLKDRVRARGKGYAMLVVIAALGASALVFSLVRAQAAIQRRFDQYMTGQHAASVGFNDELMLGSMTSMLNSEEVVMRIRGKQPDYLRGVVYDTYEGGEWREGTGRELTVIRDQPHAPVENRTVATFDGQLERAFLPLEACNIHTVGPSDIDQNGVVRPVVNHVLEGVEYRARCEGAGLGRLRAANDRELRTPPSMRATLATVLREWNIEGTPRERLGALEKRFHTRFRYSLTSVHKGGDPTMNFLRDNNEGHCEFFASGMTLLARASGIPARVVGGYRVSERAPFGDSYVVRDRDAHAWVEAFVDGAWRSYDPTPFVEGSVGARELGLVAAVREYARGALSEVGAWFVERGGMKWTATLVLAVGLVYGAMRLAVSRKRGKAEESEPIAARFAELANAIALLGEPRDPSETLDTFSARLRERKEPWAAEAADLLDRYARYRYGGIGEESELAAAVTKFSSTRHRDAPAAGAPTQRT